MHYVYPFVLYYEKETNSYAVKFEDIALFTEGQTVEEAYLKAKGFLEAYCKCNAYLKTECEPASDYLQVKENNKNEIVLLADYESDVKNNQVKSAFIVEVEN